jgi:hypothetical protein
MAEKVTMVELENTLRDDATGHLRDDCLRRLRHAADATDRQLKTGLAPDDFARLNALSTALQDARFIVRTYWDNTHQTTG